MTTARNKTKPSKGKALFWVFCAVLLLTGLVVAAIKFNNEISIKLNGSNSYYTEAYRPTVEKAAEYRRLEAEMKSRKNSGDEQGSVEPARMGFREQDIDKIEGNRYNTY